MGDLSCCRRDQVSDGLFKEQTLHEEVDYDEGEYDAFFTATMFP